MSNRSFTVCKCTVGTMDTKIMHCKKMVDGILTKVLTSANTSAFHHGKYMWLRPKEWVNHLLLYPGLRKGGFYLLYGDNIVFRITVVSKI